MELPQLFLDEMKTLLGDEFEDFLDSYNNKSFSGLRVNRNRISVEDFVKIAPFDLAPIPFVDNGFYINEEDGWSKHPYYFAGLYYLQEPSAMLPANRLPVNKDEKVLDLCAAPGGKSTELSVKGAGFLLSNDISYKRALPLVKNLEVFGADNAYVTCEDPDKLSVFFPNFFDKILVDAPCSGEGMFRKDKNLISAYLEKGPSDYQQLQSSILENAYRMLKPDGLIMYSTCTFSGLEDEEVILGLLERHDDIELEKIDLDEGFSTGYEKYISNNKELERCIHIFPHKVKGEGHFLAMLHKKPVFDSSCDFGTIDNDFSILEGNRKNKKNHFNKKNSNMSNYISCDELPEEVKNFLLGFNNDQIDYFKNKKFFINSDNYIYMLPDCEINQIRGLRFLRTGVIIGSYDTKKGFLPHTAMALVKGNNQFSNCLDLSSNEDLVIKYLKGETLVLPGDDGRIAGLKKGFCLVRVDGFSLGFAKFDGNKFKNLYEKGWRLI